MKKQLQKTRRIGQRETEKRNADMNYVNVMHAIHLCEAIAARFHSPP